MATITLEFEKHHANGNSFLLFDLRPPHHSASTLLDRIKANSRTLAHVHFGLGFDQILVLTPDPKNEYSAFLRIINVDGNESGMCANGLRSAAYFMQRIHPESITNQKEFILPTLRQKNRLTILQSSSEFAQVRSCVDVLSFEPSQRLHEPLFPGILPTEFSQVDMGNPHAVFFFEPGQDLPTKLCGSTLEHQPQFTERSNVEFAQIVNPTTINLEVHERGVGPTLSCGSGGAATAWAASARTLGKEFITGREKPTWTIHQPGGPFSVHCDAISKVATIEGPVRWVASGKCLLP